MNNSNSSVYDSLLKCANKPYNTKLVSKNLILLKYSQNERQKDDLRMAIFLGAAKLFVKAINNFFFLVQTVPKEKLLHSEEDITSECYMVLTSCINNLKIQELKKFYFYLNTSLNRRMHRIYERNYKKHFGIVPNTEDNEIKASTKGYNHHFDMSAVDLQDFNELEIAIINFKSSGEKLNKFLKDINIPSTQYYELLECIKSKLIDRYSEEMKLWQINQS